MKRILSLRYLRNIRNLRPPFIQEVPHKEQKHQLVQSLPIITERRTLNCVKALDYYLVSACGNAETPKRSLDSDPSGGAGVRAGAGEAVNATCVVWKARRPPPPEAPSPPAGLSETRLLRCRLPSLDTFPISLSRVSPR